MNNLPCGTSGYDKLAPWNQEQIGTCKVCDISFDATNYDSDICEDCWDEEDES